VESRSATAARLEEQFRAGGELLGIGYREQMRALLGGGGVTAKYRKTGAASSSDDR
jgi:hypothetical protein